MQSSLILINRGSSRARPISGSFFCSLILISFTDIEAFSFSYLDYLDLVLLRSGLAFHD
ncbi:unnamed protein product [Moneuplotes crassus]|uniref:Uncharacterized protein n=1 Tax=Euplotes crassus TaxID=5936 RepID=A0AAD1Y535_EUPCR|nr:unnamed protein product [Moneuplotes crassus]